MQTEGIPATWDRIGLNNDACSSAAAIFRLTTTEAGPVDSGPALFFDTGSDLIRRGRFAGLNGHHELAL